MTRLICEALVQLCLLGSSLFLLKQLFMRTLAISERGPEWLDEFSLESYAPMERLLCMDDSSIRLPGKNARRKLRAERRRIFRAYLQNLIENFRHLHLMGRFMLLHSQVDRPDLAMALVCQWLIFWRAVVLIEVALLRHALGSKAIDVASVSCAFNGFLVQVRNRICRGRPVTSLWTERLKAALWRTILSKTPGLVHALSMDSLCL
jgi:hypothetical protein